MLQPIQSYIIYGLHEISRAPQVKLLQTHLPNALIVEPIFPSKQKVPFMQQLLQNALLRKGSRLSPAEIGVFMSHRKVWKAIAAKQGGQHFLVLESDSQIKQLEVLEKNMPAVETSYDLFFWGAWNNHVSIKKSTAKRIQNKYIMGSPLIRSVYGAYGYSLNAKAAKYLLQQSKKINHPVDLYKYYVDPARINIGAIQPEVIATWQTTDSSIRKEQFIDKTKRIIIIKIFNLRNKILAYFC